MSLSSRITHVINKEDESSSFNIQISLPNLNLQIAKPQYEVGLFIGEQAKMYSQTLVIAYF